MPRNRPARLALVLALAGRSAHGESPMPSIKPEILLLDEPLGALTRIRLQDELLRIWQAHRVTMIFVTHDVEEAIYLSDRVLVMQSHPGRITREIALDLHRPRDRAFQRFTEIRQQILNDMGALTALAA
jgi:sulfonate transport system ATP-binding protein